MEIVRRRDGGDGAVDPDVRIPHPLQVLALALRQGVEELLMRLHAERRLAVLVAARDQAAIREHHAFRRLNVAAILRTLDAIATKAYEQSDPNDYEKLLFNTGGALDLLVRGGSIVLPGMAPIAADVAINFEDPVARTGGRVRDVGDLAGVIAVDTLDATGSFLHPRPEALTTNGPRGYLTVGARAAIDIRAGVDTSSTLKRRIE